MFILRIAQLNIKINNHYKYLEKICKDYIVEDTNYDFEIDISNEDIKYEQSISKDVFPAYYLETIACYRLISKKIINYDGFLLHGSVLKVDNDAYCFSAPSGTGKTTHTKLWQEYLQDKMTFINGDKPIIRIIDNIPYAFGTPWNGKEGYGTNDYAPLKALCFIERGIDNEINDLPKEKVISKLANQIIIPNEIDALDKTINLINKMLDYTKTYVLKCNMDISSAILSYNYMNKK